MTALTEDKITELRKMVGRGSRIPLGAEVAIDFFKTDLPALLDAASAALLSLETRVRELEAALRPFADLGQTFLEEEYWKDEEVICGHSVSEYRCAARALVSETTNG